MKTKTFKFFLTLLIVFFVSPVFAQERIIDNAGLLSPQEKASLQKVITSAASAYNFDLVIVTEKNIGSSYPADYADDFFDRNGYGLGQNRDGCLFLLVTEDRDYRFSTSGRGIKILTSAAANKLENNVVKFLRESDFYVAFYAFLANWDEFLALDAKGRSYNFFHEWNLVLVLIAWVLSLVIGLIVVRTWKKGMDTVFPQTQAATYMVTGSLAFNEKKDSFLYSTVNKTRIQSQGQNIASSGNKGIKTGLSGNRHGGRGGKF